MCNKCNQLRATLKLAATVIKKQRQQIDDVQVITWQVMREAQGPLRQGGLPRGTWSLLRGRLEVAQMVYRMIWWDWSTGILELIKVI